MITQPTVLILGAGASRDYQFPLGQDLYWQVVAADDSLVRVLEGVGFGAQEVEDFKSALRRSGAMSVDSFLEGRPDMLDIGKAAIAWALIRMENVDLLFREPLRDREDWYRYFFNSVLIGPSGAKDLGAISRNMLTIVTYNYDRSFEYWFLMALHHGLGQPLEDCIAVMDRIPMIYLHGKLGEIIERAPSGRAYDIDLSAESLSKAAAGIRIIHEGEDDTPELERARVAIGGASQVIFLGFGYHPVNVQRLRLAEVHQRTVVAAERGQRDGPVRFWGTAFGLSEEERKVLVEPLFRGAGGVRLGASTETVKGFLVSNLGLFVAGS